jgi:ribosome biogenesis GTPase
LIEQYGWSPAWADLFEPFRASGARPARVIRQEYGAWLCASDEGEKWVRTARRHVAAVTGDWVACTPCWSRLEAVLPRRGVLERKAAGRRVEPQVLAANVDVALIVMGLDQDYNLARLERYLLLAGSGGVRPVVVLNKRDACPDAHLRFEETAAAARGAPVLLLSALLDDVPRVLSAVARNNETAALLGSSGAGKSTIANRLLGADIQPTAPVRAADGRGVHTTTGRWLTPLSCGWLLADLPGLREVMPWHARPDAAPPGALRHQLADLERKRHIQAGKKSYRALKDRKW